jgi:hypothetical protein
VHTTTYAIEVRGSLPSALAGELASFAQYTVDGSTVLTGPVPDTAALYGLLYRLEALGVALVAVRPAVGDLGET